MPTPAGNRDMRICGLTWNCKMAAHLKHRLKGWEYNLAVLVLFHESMGDFSVLPFQILHRRKRPQNPQNSIHSVGPHNIGDFGGAFYVLKFKAELLTPHLSV